MEIVYGGETEVLTPAVNFDSRKFKGHFSSSFSSTGGGGGLQRTKYGKRAYTPPKHESTRNGQAGMLFFELQIYKMLTKIRPFKLINAN